MMWSRTWRRAGARWKATLGMAVMALCGGCVEQAAVESLDVAPPNKELAQRVDEALDSVFQRRLNLRDHAAWQILHGALAFQRSFMVETEPGGDLVSAVEHVLAGGQMRGWTVGPGVLLDEARRGLSAQVEAGSKTGQGHQDQWLAILAQCELPPEQTIRVGQEVYTMADYVGQVQWDVPRNFEREYSWTLIGLTTYLPTDATWIAQDGQEWGIERLVASELEQDLASSACGGSHRLIGVAMALNRHLAQEGELSGVWQRADLQLQEAIAAAEQYQNPDGSFSTSYFHGQGSTPDLAQDLGATGHVLEFLTLAMTDEQLEAPWVARAVSHLCDLFHKTREVSLECGALYHAAHGLALYRQRRFTARDASPLP